MTYPSVPLGDQWDHPELADPTVMHARIDVPLNAAAAVMRAQPGDNRIAVVKTTTGTQASASTVVFDTVRSDPLAAYNASTGVWTCPASGIYLMSVRLGSGSTDQIGCRIVGLDTAIYPFNLVASAMTAPALYETANIASFPVIAVAGQTYTVQVYTLASALWTPETSASGLDRCTWTIDYVGAFTGPTNPGTAPAVPLVGDQWIDGEPITDLKLYRRFDQPMDTLQPYLAGYGSQRVAFLGSYIGKTTPTGSPVPFDVEFDTLAGWGTNADNAWRPGADGLYLISAGVREANVDQTISWRVDTGSAFQYWRGSTRAAGGGVQRGGSLAAIRYLQTDANVQLSTSGFDTAATLSTWLAAVQIG